MAGLSLPVRTEVLGLLETAKAEIARLDTLVEEFLSLSSIDRLTPVPTPPGQLIEEVMILMTPLARERGIAVAVVPDEKAPWVRLDREKMKQVLINLVRNAIEAMPEGGTLTVGASHGARTVFLNVSDTGIGIPPGQDVYDFFVTTKRGGTGLGLPIARRIVEAHGGSLKYESRPGEGTVFTISLAVPDHDPGGGVERRAR
jgi:signal transduction histidine kinase